MKRILTVISLLSCSAITYGESLDTQIKIPEIASIGGQKYIYKLETLRANWSDFLNKTRAAIRKGESPEEEKVQASRRNAGIRAVAASVIAAGVFVKDEKEVDDLFTQTLALLKDEPVPTDIQFPGQLFATLTGIAFSSEQSSTFGATLSPTLEQVVESPQLTFSDIVMRAKQLIKERAKTEVNQ